LFDGTKSTKNLVSVNAAAIPVFDNVRGCVEHAGWLARDLRVALEVVPGCRSWNLELGVTAALREREMLFREECGERDALYEN